MVRGAAPAIVILIVALGIPATAQAARVTSLKPWAASNEYLVTADLDGRTQPKSEPREKVDYLRKGQWVRIQCQDRGELVSGSRIWDKVGPYYVPDHFIKTYADGFLQGVPRCSGPASGGPAPPPSQPTPPAGDDPSGPTAPPPAPAPGRGCADTRIRVGPLLATASCFRREGKAFVASGQVRIAGVDVRTSGADAEVRVVPSELSVSTRGQTEISVDNLVLYRREFKWDVGRRFEFSVQRGVKLRGLPLTGGASFAADARTRSVLVGLNVELPGVLGGITGATNIRAGGEGIAVGDVKVAAGSARIGAFEVRDLALAYSDVAGTPHFEGQGTLVLPSPLAPTVTARVGFGLGDGFFRAGGDISGLNRPLPFAAGVFLQRIRFDIAVNPVRLTGGIGVSAGPRLLGREAVSVDGDFTYEEGDPDRYAISGSARLVDIPLASGSVSYQTDGRFDMSAQVDLDKLGVGFEGGLAGWVDGANAFNFQGNGRVKAGPFGGGGEAVISSAGVAGCRRGRGPDVGFGYGWGEPTPRIFHSSCNLGDWVVSRDSRSAGPGTFGSFAIAPGQPVATFSVVGLAAPPRVVLTGPGGAPVAVTPDDPFGGIDDGRVLLFQNLADRTTYIAVENPAGGLYRLSLRPGSPPAGVFRSAQSLAPPQVRARVRGRGYRRVLRWSFKSVRGRSVVFYEQGRDTRRRLKATSRRRGAVRFTVPSGRAGRREIVAHVNQDRLPQSAGVVASYTAPRPLRPQRPRFVRVSARGGRLVVRWGGARRAAGYEVRIRLSDGRRLLILQSARTRRLTEPGVGVGTRASVTVRGLSATGRRGPGATDRVTVRSGNR